MNFQFANASKIEELKSATPARIGIGRCGARYTTGAQLSFLAAHATANDAVVNEVSEDLVKSLGVFEVQTECADKDEMLLRPDLGRLFSDQTKKIISENCIHNPDVQIYFGDGLSAPSVKANIALLFPALKTALEAKGITVGAPFFVRYCRVNTARIIGPLLGAKITCVLIGERPGLLTAESTSAYMAYNARPDMDECDYTVVSSIDPHGLLPEDASSHIADLMELILREEKSGVALKLAAKGKVRVSLKGRV